MIKNTNFEKKIAINEIFYSIQGEGSWVGTPMVFIRVAGCNLRCSWCDTPETIKQGYQDRQGIKWNLSYKRYTVGEILGQVRTYPTNHVVLTGGEPTVHKLDELVNTLRNRNYKIHLESNGTKIENWIVKLDWICISPKRGEQIHKVFLLKADEFKWIVDPEFSIEETYPILSLLDDFRMEEVKLFLQPANYQYTVDPLMLKKSYDLVSKHPKFRLSAQLHKFIGVK